MTSSWSVHQPTTKQDDVGMSTACIVAASQMMQALESSNRALAEANKREQRLLAAYHRATAGGWRRRAIIDPAVCRSLRAYNQRWWVRQLRRCRQEALRERGAVEKIHAAEVRRVEAESREAVATIRETALNKKAELISQLQEAHFVHQARLDAAVCEVRSAANARIEELGRKELDNVFCVASIVASLFDRAMASWCRTMHAQTETLHHRVCALTLHRNTIRCIAEGANWNNDLKAAQRKATSQTYIRTKAVLDDASVAAYGGGGNVCATCEKNEKFVRDTCDALKRERKRRRDLELRLQTVGGQVRVLCRVRGGEDGSCFQDGEARRRPPDLSRTSSTSAEQCAPKSDKGHPSAGPAHVNVQLAGLENLQQEMPPTLAMLSDTEVQTVGGDGSLGTIHHLDGVLSPSCSQTDVYAATEGIAASVVEGFDACMFAYGQTASGKTHTMIGTKDDPGVAVRAISHVFDNLCGSAHSLSSSKRASVNISMTEIYNEGVIDLLGHHQGIHGSNGNPSTKRTCVRTESKKAPDHSSTARDSQHSGTDANDLNFVDCHSHVEALALIDRGLSHRHSAVTRMNDRSSRAHVIITLRVAVGAAIRQGLRAGPTCSHLYLVDLAGSERPSKTGAEGKALVEAKHINKSLVALGQVLQALANGQGFVPYRNSKLTMMLRDALSNGAKVLMLAHVSARPEHRRETSSTLAFASMVHGVMLGRSRRRHVNDRFGSGGRGGIGDQMTPPRLGGTGRLSFSRHAGRGGDHKMK